MVTQSQAAHVIALVHERHSAVRQTLEGLLNAYAMGDQSQIIAANERFRGALHQLESVVAAEHWPTWLKDLVKNADRYATNHDNGLSTWRAHLESILNHRDGLNVEDWSFTESLEKFLDVDEIIDNARRDHRIEELYSSVITCIENLIESGEIDSLRAFADLQKIAATLQKAKSGSFSTQIFSWRFARRLIPNILSAYVKRSDITGPLMEAFEQTAAELDVSLSRAKDQIGKQILVAATDAFRSEAALAIAHEQPLFLEDLRSDEATSESHDPKELDSYI